MQTLPSSPTQTSTELIHARGNLGRGLLDADAPFEWTATQQKAALCFAGVLLPPGKTSPTSVAAACGTSVDMVRGWRNHPEFIRKVNELIKLSSEEIMEAGLAMKAARVLELQKRHAMLTGILEAREEWAAIHAEDDIVRSDAAGNAFTIPGVGSGALVLKHRSIGSGMNQEIVVEGEFDAALFLELRSLETQIARELGQLNPSTSVSINMKMYGNIDVSAV